MVLIHNSTETTSQRPSAEAPQSAEFGQSISSPLKKVFGGGRALAYK
jgi:hypothetical protein